MNFIKEWNSRVIRFREDGFVCLTDMAIATNKKVSHWNELKSTNEYLQALESYAGMTAHELICTIETGDNDQRGTWAHRRVAIRFAQWCSPEFAVQVDSWIEELFTFGRVEIKPQPVIQEAKETIELIDLIFANVPLKPELIAGLKLNTVQQICPAKAEYLEPSRQLLINSTAQEFQLLTPTDIGKRLNISAKKVNQLLVEKGLQVKNDNKKSRKDPSYLPTDRGSEFADFTLSTGKEKDNTSYQQLRWYESVLSFLGLPAI